MELCLVQVFFLFGIYWKATATPSHHHMDKTEKCIVESHVTKHEAQYIDGLNLPYTHEGKCYTACVFKSIGIIDHSGECVSKRKYMELFKKYEPHKSEMLTEWEEKNVSSCVDEANDEIDDCEMAYVFMKCIMSNGRPSTRTISIKLPETVNISLPPLTLALLNLG